MSSRCVGRVSTKNGSEWIFEVLFTIMSNWKWKKKCTRRSKGCKHRQHRGFVLPSIYKQRQCGGFLLYCEFHCDCCRLNYEFVEDVSSIRWRDYS